MTSRDFCFWLQGVIEVADIKEFSSKQTQIIKNHLNLVFVHEIDPSMGDEEHQIELNNIHEGYTSHDEGYKLYDEAKMRC